MRAGFLVAAGVAVTGLVVSPVSGQEPDPLELEGLVVTATPVPVALSALGASVTVLDGDDLRARGHTRVVEALRGVPGLVVARNGSFGAVTSVFFRGAESDHVQVLVDGVQVNQPGGAFDFSSLGLDEVERIEVVRGPGSALYGSDAVAGVIQVITRRGGGAPRGTATVRAGSFGRLDGSVSLTGGTDALAYGLTLSRTTTDGILPFNNRATQTTLSAQARARLDAATHLRVAVRTADHRYAFPTDGSGAVVDRNQATFGDEASVAVEVDRRLGSRVDLRALLTLHDVEGGTDDAPDGPADTLGFFGYQSLDAMRRTALDVRADVAVGAGATLTAGVEVEGQRVRSFSESRSEYGPSTDRAGYRRDNRAGYLHVLGEWGALAGNAGVRVEDNDQYGRFASGQLGASLRLGDATRLRAAAGSGVKEPTFYEAYASGFSVGNPDLDPERSVTVEAGVDRALLRDALRVRATVFRTSLRDLIQYTFTTPEPGAPNFFNVAEARSRGLEVGLEGRMGDVALSLDWTRLDTEVVDAGFDEGPSAVFVEGEALLRRPRDQVRAAVAWRGAGALSMDGAVRVTGERSDRDFSTFPAAPVTLARVAVLDVGAEWRVARAAGSRPGVTLFLRAENLLDEAYQEVFGFQAPGRGLYGGGRVTFGGR